jgi:hypothetical protein
MYSVKNIKEKLAATGYRKIWPWLLLRYYSRIYQKGLRNTAKVFMKKVSKPRVESINYRTRSRSINYVTMILGVSAVG